MHNTTFQRANLSPFAKMLTLTPQGENNTTPDVFMQCLYSSEQRWEGMIAEVHQNCFPREEPIHLRPSAQSTLVLQLQGVVDLRRQGDGRTEQGRLYRGAICLEPPESLSTFFCQETVPASILSLGLAPSLFEQTVAETGRHDPTHVELVKQFNLHDPLLEQIGLALVAQLAAGEGAGRLYAEALARTLALHLLHLSSRAWLVSLSSQRNLTSRQIALLRDYMYDRLDQDISLRELAASVNVSVSYFTRLFKQSLGLTPHQYLIACRVERAKSLILQGGLTLAEVAHAVGFADQSHLNRHFKRLLGIAPRMLCKNVQKEKKNIQDTNRFERVSSERTQLYLRAVHQNKGGFQMGTFRQDGPNLILELDHQETTNLIEKEIPAGEAAVAGFLKVVGVPVFVVGIVAAVFVLHDAWEIPAIKAADKGQGVILTAPGFFARVWFDPAGAAILLIPSTRYEFDNDGWSAKDDDVIGSSEGDVIQTHIDHTGDPKTVVFRLNNQSPLGWYKAFVLRDGLAGEWWVQAKGFSQAENGLWADQVHNGQSITFWKPKFLGQWAEIFSISHLERLTPGSIVTFTWTKD